MTLSPFEVERREFGSAPMGYKKRDVDSFVDEVHRSLRELWEERGDLREENERLKERLARFEQLEDQLKNTLLLAQDSAEKAHEQARRESELLLREAGQKSRDIVHAAHEEKQKLEMVLRDLHGAEQEARQRLRAMSGAILSHLDDTEQLVNESTSNFRAVVQAHPEATELRSSNLETMAEHAERAAVLAEAEAAAAELAAAAAHVAAETVETVAAEAERVALDFEAAAEAVERIEAQDPKQASGQAATSSNTAETRRDSAVDGLGTGAAQGATADAFFDSPPSFDPTDVAPRDRASSSAEKR